MAGKEFETGQPGAWIRPVSKSHTGELSELDQRYSDGTDPALLDIIEIYFLQHKPHNFQTENHLIDDQYYWIKKSTAGWSDLVKSLDAGSGPLWHNGSSSGNGINDRVLEGVANNLANSLYLIRTKDLQIIVQTEGLAFGPGKRKVRGRFTHAKNSYLFSITDPKIERQYLAGTDGQFDVGEAILCVSLGEPFNGHAYKLIAAVFLQ